MRLLPFINGAQKPPAPAQINWDHPFSLGLILSGVFNEHATKDGAALSLGLFTGNGARTRRAVAGGGAIEPTWAVNRGGPCIAFTDVFCTINLGESSAFPTDAVTVAIIRRKVDATARNSYLFTLGDPASDTVIRIAAPYGDGTFYWQFGDNVTKLITIPGLTYHTRLESWICSHGPRGFEVWRDGVLIASDPTVYTRTATSDDAFLGNSGALTAADLQEINCIHAVNHQWSAQMCRWWSAEPYAHLYPGPLERASRSFFFGAPDTPPGQFTVELNGEDVTDLIRTGEDFQDPHFEFEVGQPGVLEFDIELTVKPAKFQKVVLWNKAGTQRVFGGIVEYAKQLDVLYAAPLKVYRVTAVDYSRYFDFFYWTKRYETDKTVKEVLQDFWAENDIASAIVDGGYALTLSAAQADGPTISGPFTYDNVKGSAVIADLEQRSKESATPMVRSMTPSGVFRMREYGDTVAPVTLSTALQNLSAFRASDSTQIRANTIIGAFGTTGEGEDEIRHEWAPADGVQTTFSLEGYNVPASSTPPGVVRIDGVDTPMLLPHEAGANDIEWNHALDGGSVIFNGTSSSLVPLGTVLSVLYVPKYPFTVRRTNGGTPRVEATYSDPKVSHYPQAVQALDAELASTDQDPRIFDADTLEDGFELYQLAPVDVPEMDADDTEGIVTGVRAVLHTADPDEVEASFWEYSLVIEELGSGAVLQADPTTRLRQAVRSAV